MDHAGFEFEGEAHGELEIVGEYGGGEAVGGVVGQGEGVIGVAGFAHGGNGAEEFVAEGGHFGRHVGDHRWMIEIAFVFSACDQAGAGGDGVFDFFVDHGALRGADERADYRVGIARVADLEGGGFGGKALQEFFIDRGFDDDARAGHADLSLVDENAEAGGVHGVVQIRIFQNNQRAFAAHFEDYSFAALGAFGGDDAADDGGAGEGNEFYTWIVVEDLGHGAAVAGNDVEDSGGGSGALKDLGEL